MGKGGKKHLKKLVTPRAWPIEKKDFVWTTKPKAGMHWLEYSIPVSTVLKMLGKAKNKKEAVKIIKGGEIFIDGKARKEPKFALGFMDVLSIPKIDENFRAIFSERGYITLLPITKKDATFKICRIEGKKSAKEKFQYALHDGRNLLSKEKYGAGDVLKISLPDQKVMDCFAFERGNLVYIIEGKHIGKIGKIKEIENGTMTRPAMAAITVEKEEINVPARCCFIIGKDKPEIKVN